MGPNTPAPLSPQEQLQARLSDPRTIGALNRLPDRLDLIAFSVEKMDGFLRRGESGVQIPASASLQFPP